MFISFRLCPHCSYKRNQQHSSPQQDAQSSNRHSTQRTLTGQVRLNELLSSLQRVLSHYPNKKTGSSIIVLKYRALKSSMLVAQDAGTFFCHLKNYFRRKRIIGKVNMLVLAKCFQALLNLIGWRTFSFKKYYVIVHLQQETT